MSLTLGAREVQKLSGWIKLHRKITEHWIWEDPEKLKWWLDLIMMANHQPRDILINDEIIEIDTGERHTSEVKLAERWKTTRGKVRRFLNLLEKDEMIKISKSRQKGTTYKVLNYSNYQAKKESDEHRMNIERTSNEQRMDIERTSNEHKQELKELEELKELKEVAVEDEVKKEKKTKNSSSELPLSKNVFRAWENLWMFPNHVQQEILVDLSNIYSDELVVAAIKIAGSKDVVKGRAINFIEAVLKEWEDNNVKTIEQARDYQRNRNKQNQQQNYKNASYSTKKDETLPDWAQEDYKPEVIDDEVVISQDEVKSRLERLRKMREEQLND